MNFARLLALVNYVRLRLTARLLRRLALRGACGALRGSFERRGSTQRMQVGVVFCERK